MASQRRGFAPGLQKICRSPRINQGYVRVEMASLLYGDGCFPRREWQQPQKDGVWEREARFCSDKGDGPLTHTHSGSLKVGNPPSQRHLADPPSPSPSSPSITVTIIIIDIIHYLALIAGFAPRDITSRSFLSSMSCARLWGYTAIT